MDTSRISTCTYPMREREIDYALRVCAEAGFKKADVWGRAPHFSEDQSQCDWPALKQTAAELGIAVANLGTYPGSFFIAATDVQREAEMCKMKAAIEGAAYFGARSIRVSPGHGEDPAIVDRVTPYFIEAAAYAAEKNVYLGMENHRGSIAGNPQVVAELCRNVNSPHFGVIYEPCNLLAIEVDYKQALDTLGDWVVHTHIKDGTWESGEYQRVHLGDGDVDFVWVVEQLEAAGYEGDYALEYEVGNIEPVETGMSKWYDRFTAAFN